MTHTQATVWVAMSIVVAFAFGTILWVREGHMDRLTQEVDDLKRENVLAQGRVRNLADWLGVDINDPVPDGPDDKPAAEYAPEGWDAPREWELVDLEPDDDTVEIPVVDPMGPATVPTAVVIADGWRDLDEMYAEAKAAIAAIGEAT